MNQTLAFVLLLLGTVLWISLPLIPAVRELMNPRDAGPLDAVGNDSGDLTFFADSFRQFVESGGLASAAAGTGLPDGRVVARLTASAAPTVDRQTGLVVAEAATSWPAREECQAELFGCGDLEVGTSASIRAAYSPQQLTLAPHVTVLRWVHGEGGLLVGDDVHLLGRATSRGTLALGRGVLFDRVLAPHVVVADRVIPPAAAGVLAWQQDERRPQFELARAAAILAPSHWLVDENLEIPEGHIFTGALVVRGTLRVGANCEVRGSIKAHGTVTLGENVVVTGTAASRKDVILGPGSQVHGPVIAADRVQLQAGARVGQPSRTASISADEIILAQGAEVFGSLAARLRGATEA